MQSQSNKTSELTLLSLLIAMALVLSYFENIIPIRLVFAFPGIKLGLANIITLLAIGKLDYKKVYLILFIRVIMSSIFMGSAMSFFYSIVGGFLSLSFMLFFNIVLADKVSIVGISAIGGIFHNIGQLIVLGFFTNSLKIPFIMSPKLILAGLITGLFMGYVAHFIRPYFISASL